MRAEFPLVQISSRLQQDVGEIEGTPLILLADRAGQLVTWLRGLQSEAVLRELIERIDADSCAAGPG